MTKPTPAMISHALSCLDHVEWSGDYWGNKSQWRKRHMKTAEWLESLLKTTRDRDNG